MTILDQDVIDRMSDEDRFELIGALWDSLENPLPLSAAQREELESRIATVEAVQASAIRWADLRAELAARLP